METPFVRAPERAKPPALHCGSDRISKTGMVAAVVVAAGRGLRAGGDRPKQYRCILNEPVIRPSLATFANHSAVAAVQPVIHAEDAGLFAAAAAGLALLPPVHGAATRQGSVRAGLEALA